MKKFKCECCGGHVNPYTMKCEYCGTQYEQVSDDVIRIKVQQSIRPTKMYQISLDIPNYIRFNSDDAYIINLIKREVSDQLVDAIMDNMQFVFIEDIRHYGLHVDGAISLVVPDKPSLGDAIRDACIPYNLVRGIK